MEFKKQSKVQAMSHIDGINRACNHIFKVFVNLQITDSGNEVFMSLMRATNLFFLAIKLAHNVYYKCFVGLFPLLNAPWK